jgi:hypothetical protein
VSFCEDDDCMRVPYLEQVVNQFLKVIVSSAP